jgi:hypothetical protein
MFERYSEKPRRILFCAGGKRTSSASRLFELERRFLDLLSAERCFSAGCVGNPELRNQRGHPRANLAENKTIESYFPESCVY